METREKLSPTDSIKYYLFKSLRRKIISELKKAKNQAEMDISSEDSNLVFPHEIQLITEQLTKEKKEALNKSLDALPLKQREAIFLLFYDNLSYQEVSSILSINLTSVYTLVWKAIENLRKSFPDSLICLIYATTATVFRLY